MEKAGIPSVGIAARSFARAWQSCVDGWGQPATAFVTIPHACTGQQPDYIHKMVDEQIDNIILGLTRMSASADLSGAANGHSETDVFTVTLDDSPWGLDARQPLHGRAGLERRHAHRSAHAGGGGSHAQGHPPRPAGRGDGHGAGLRPGHSGEDRHQRGHGRLPARAVPHPAGCHRVHRPAGDEPPGHAGVRPHRSAADPGQRPSGGPGRHQLRHLRHGSRA